MLYWIDIGDMARRATAGRRHRSGMLDPPSSACRVDETDRRRVAHPAPDGGQHDATLERTTRVPYRAVAVRSRSGPLWGGAR